MTTKNKELNNWEKEFDELPKSKLTTKQFIAKTLKAQKFALEKEYSWSYGRLLRKELKAKDKEFIEILNGLEMEEMKKRKRCFSF